MPDFGLANGYCDADFGLANLTSTTYLMGLVKKGNLVYCIS